MPLIMRTFAHPPRKPRRFAFRSIDPDYRVYGWNVRIARAALEFSRLEVRGRRAFSLSGSGSAVVRTWRRYAPGKRYEMRVDGPTHSTVVRKADRRGRLRVRVDLGPANPHQQYTDEADADGGTVVRTAVVRILRA
jgi:hypothetical protein